MSGISEIQARIHAIQHRAQPPALPGRFQTVLNAQFAEVPKASSPGDVSSAEALDPGQFVVTPQGQASTIGGLDMSAAQGMTLGMMLGITGTPTIAPRSATVVRSADLTEYLQINGIEYRNGHLGSADLVEVSGGWTGSARLLPPAAAAWEEMRAAAATDGIDLRAIDSYRSWDVQEGAYHAHLRGEKTANVLPPGQSEHGNGLAVDVTNGHLVGVGDREYTWLRTNGAQYGWYPISNESWHWEFRGVLS